ncbi:terminase large subunit [Acetobacter pasteurianus]|uniref:Phage terminase large subunit n=1 Tax=Acetobacter pasteurianus NBRC 3188 TaxID=1226663 RepID=A0A401WUG5_ACEPA|nr:terminase large subunit [Acetobacter pasteurianus]GCD52983.1 phage terminase large subunit [Acetobacter pasteurianus NBRC 3188]
MASETEKKPATRKRKATTTARKTATATTRRKAAPAAKAVLSWSTACRDWEKRIIAGESLVPCDLLFPDAAAQGMAVFNALKIVDVLGEPTIGESCRDWLKDFAAAIFGSYDPETGKRMITEFFLLVSKKNTKSTIAAGVMLTVLILNWRQSAEFLILAPTKEAADNAFKPARDMIKADPELDALFHVQDYTRIVTHRETGATLKVVAADGSSVVGKKATGILVDELWEFGKKPTAENMLMEATGGIASRPEGFIIYLSTQSDEEPAGVFKSRLEYARGVRDGKINSPRFLPVIYEFPKKILDKKGEHNPDNWYMTNPNLGVSVSDEFLRDRYAQAKEAGEGVLRVWMAKHLNVEMGMSLREKAWAGAKYWERQGDPLVTLELILECSDVIVCGIDGGGLDDFLSLAVLGRDEESGDWLHWQRSWVFQDVLKHRKEEAPRYLDFQKQGDLVIVHEMRDDNRQLADVAEMIDQSGKLAMVGLDPAGVAEIVFALHARGIEQERIVGISQGWKMTGAIKTLERKLADGTFSHGARPIMAWAVGNAKAQAKGNNIEITKQMAGGKKIDPLMALFDAVACMSRNPEPPIQSIYDREELWES